MFGEGLWRPMIFPPITLPPPVSGAELPGNDSTAVTEKGKTFLVTILNLAHNAIKIFGDDEGIPFDSSAWPGLDLSTPEDKFQFINYVGKNQEHAVDWGDLSRVDFDFDGDTDSGRKIEDVLPFALYKEGTDSNSTVDYTAIWDEVKNNLSSDNSFWQDLQDKTYPTSDEGCFDWLVGANEAKRRWIYGMTAIGINPNHPNASGATDNFNNIFDSWKMQEAGGLNIQTLQNYIGLRLMLAERFNVIAQDRWINDTAVLSAKNYYASRVSQVDIDLDKADTDAFKSALDSLKDMLDDSGKLKLPPREPDETDAEYEARKAEIFNRARTYLNQMGTALTNLNGNYQTIDQGFVLVPENLMADERQLSNKRGEYQELIPDTIDETTVFTDLVHKANEIKIHFIFIDLIQDRIKTNLYPINDLFNELKAPLSTEPLSDELKAAIGIRFTGAAAPSLNRILSTAFLNNAIRATNRIKQKRYADKSEERAQERKEEAKAAAKKHPSWKKDEKKVSERIAAQVQAARIAESRSDRKLKSNVQPLNRVGNKRRVV